MEVDEKLQPNESENLQTFEELYSSIENMSTTNGEGPSICESSTQSTTNFGSWTLSPISEIHSHPSQPHMSNDEKTGGTEYYYTNQQPSGPAMSLQENGDNFSYGYNLEWEEMYSWHCPSTCVGGNPVSNDRSQTWGFCAPVNLVNSNTSTHNDQHNDPLINLNNQNVEFTRCSTPEYLMALNSLKPTDPEVSMVGTTDNEDTSRPSILNNTLNNSNATNSHIATSISATSVNNDKLNKNIYPSGKNVSKIQDSGYSSDLNASPVIQYQNTNAKSMVTMTTNNEMPGKHCQASTPVPCYPILRVANINRRKENIPPIAHRNVSPRLSMSMPGFTPKSQTYPDLSQFNVEAGFAKSLSYSMKKSQIQSSDVSTSTTILSSKTKCTPTSTVQSDDTSDDTSNNTNQQEILDCTSKLDNEEDTTSRCKRSLSPDSEKENDDVKYSTGQNSKRRRHNEPLNNQAIQIMTDWYHEHIKSPYPTKAEKEQLAKSGGISVAQVKSWFANKRNRSNNTRPKKQKLEMTNKLLDICHQLARDSVGQPNKDNAYYIQQLSTIINSDA